MVRHSSLWFETCPTRCEITSGLIKNVDTLIIGGGIAGISLLYYLVNSGMVNTYLVEESSIGFRSSGRGVGQLMFRGPSLFHQMPDGEEYLSFISENNRRFLNGLRTLSFDKDLIECGGLRLAVSEEELALLEKESELIKRVRGIECPILSKKGLEVLMPSRNFYGGMFVPNEVSYNPYKIINGLRDVIEKSGTRVFTNTQVESVVTNDDGSLTVSIRHRGTIRAKQIVYCTGVYTSSLLTEFKDILVPFREHIIASDYIMDNDIIQTIPSMSMSCNDGNERLRLYNNRMIASGMRRVVRGQQEGIIYDGEISSTVYDKLRFFVADTFPSLKSVKYTHAWSSVYCSTPDNKPLIGPVPNKANQYMLTGFGCYDASNVIFGSMLIKQYIKGYNVSDIPGNSILNPGRFFHV